MSLSTVHPWGIMRLLSKKSCSMSNRGTPVLLEPSKFWVILLYLNCDKIELICGQSRVRLAIGAGCRAHQSRSPKQPVYLKAPAN